MDSSRLTVPLDAIREAARARVAVTSLRAFASETGVSYTAVRWFLGGGQPYSENLQKLSTWYVESVPEAAARASLASLLAGLPDAFQEEAGREIAAVIEAAFRRAGVPVPEWIVR